MERFASFREGDPEVPDSNLQGIRTVFFKLGAEIFTALQGIDRAHQAFADVARYWFGLGHLISAVATSRMMQLKKETLEHHLISIWI